MTSSYECPCVRHQSSNGRVSLAQRIDLRLDPMPIPRATGVECAGEGHTCAARRKRASGNGIEVEATATDPSSISLVRSKTEFEIALLFIL